MKQNSEYKILVIDDDPFMAKAIEMTLKQKKFSVFVAHDAEKALNVMKGHEFNFFLVDLVLPGMNGFEFVKTIKKIPKYFNIPVLMITARMELKDTNTAKNAGADDMLIKPFDLESMSEKIEKMLKARFEV